MASIKISELAAKVTPVGTEELLINDSGTSKKITIDNIIVAGGSGGDTLPVVDTKGIAKGSVDATKIVRLEVDGLTTATTRVLTVQDADGTIALTSDITGTNSGTNTGDNTVCTSGTATTATTLETARAINGVNFDGSAAITVTANANLAGNLLTAVPSGAVFTDTVYTHPTEAGNLHVPTGGTVGQVLTNTASGTGTWQNAAGGGGVNLTSATTAPASPSAGDQWFDTANGILYAYMTDGTDSQWLDISSANGVAAASTAGGAMELISTTTVSTSVSSVEFTGVSGYSNYRIELNDILSSAAADFVFTVSNSSTYITDYDSVSHYTASGGTHAVAGTTGGASHYLWYSLSASASASGGINIYDSGTVKHISSLTIDDRATSMFARNTNGVSRGTSALDGFKIAPSTGTITAGTFSLYGIKS